MLRKKREVSFFRKLPSNPWHSAQTATRKSSDPISDNLGTVFPGQAYEIRLKDFLREKNIAFLDENDLRDQGYDKTVDIKLAVPAVINGECALFSCRQGKVQENNLSRPDRP